jgi:hypothetical protein
MATGSTSV